MNRFHAKRRVSNFPAVANRGPPTSTARTEGLARPQDLSVIQQPVIVANGDDDRMVPTKKSVVMALRLPNAELVIYPDAAAAAPSRLRAIRADGSRAPRTAVGAQCSRRRGRGRRFRAVLPGGGGCVSRPKPGFDLRPRSRSGQSRREPRSGARHHAGRGRDRRSPGRELTVPLSA